MVLLEVLVILWRGVIFLARSPFSRVEGGVNRPNFTRALVHAYFSWFFRDVLIWRFEVFFPVCVWRVQIFRGRRRFRPGLTLHVRLAVTSVVRICGTCNSRMSMRRVVI